MKGGSRRLGYIRDVSDCRVGQQTLAQSRHVVLRCVTNSARGWMGQVVGRVRCAGKYIDQVRRQRGETPAAFATAPQFRIAECKSGFLARCPQVAHAGQAQRPASPLRSPAADREQPTPICARLSFDPTGPRIAASRRYMRSPHEPPGPLASPITSTASVAKLAMPWPSECSENPPGVGFRANDEMSGSLPSPSCPDRAR